MVKIRSFIANVIYWIFHIHDLKEAIDIKNSLIVRSVADVKNIMMKFQWRKDSPLDWRPWIITIVNNQLRDDCDGAAVLGQWLLAKLGISSRLYRLKGEPVNHIICVSDAHDLMISNNQVIPLNPKQWQKDIETMFANKYRF